MKILVLGHGYEKPFEQIGEVTVVDTCELVYVNGYDLVVFTGGEDVDPRLYHEEVHPTTGYFQLRDSIEEGIFHDCIDHNIPMAGICRGSQFLTVMSGGKLVQDIDGHAIGGVHRIQTLSQAFPVMVTSTHHQMMYPFRLGRDCYEILATGEDHGEARGLPAGVDHIDEVVEAVFYPETRCLCVQFHPEYMPVDSEGFQYYQELLNTYVVNHKAA